MANDLDIHMILNNAHVCYTMLGEAKYNQREFMIHSLAGEMYSIALPTDTEVPCECSVECVRYLLSRYLPYEAEEFKLFYMPATEEKEGIPLSTERLLDLPEDVKQLEFVVVPRPHCQRRRELRAFVESRVHRNEEGDHARVVLTDLDVEGGELRTLRKWLSLNEGGYSYDFSLEFSMGHPQLDRILDEIVPILAEDPYGLNALWFLCPTGESHLTRARLSDMIRQLPTPSEHGRSVCIYLENHTGFTEAHGLPME